MEGQVVIVSRLIIVQAGKLLICRTLVLLEVIVSRLEALILFVMLLSHHTREERAVCTSHAGLMVLTKLRLVARSLYVGHVTTVVDLADVGS